MTEQYNKSYSHRESGIFVGPKTEIYKWKIKNKKGELCWIDKTKLLIDTKNYQRETTSTKKITNIASNFDWMLFEVLVVAKREDGKFYVIEGGHRLRAAWSRDDIDLVPCIVFDDKTIIEEAETFVVSALSVSNISSIDKFKAQLCAENDIALKANELVQRHGLHVCKNNFEKKGITAIQTVIWMISTYPNVADDVFRLCIEICKDEIQPSGILIRAICYLLRNKEALGFDVSKGKLKERLISIDPNVITKSMRTEAGLTGSGGEKVHARGVINLLNKGARNKLYMDI